MRNRWIAAVLFGCLIACRIPAPIPPDRTSEYEGVCRKVWREELLREPWREFETGDLASLAVCIQRQRDGVTEADLRAEVRESSEWKAKHQPPPVYSRRPGVVRTDGSVFVDDAGPFLAFGATLFWAPWGYRHDRARLEQHLQFLAERHVDYIRVLGDVGPDTWEDREIDPRWPDYDAVIANLTDLAYDKYGLRIEWSIFGGSRHVPTETDREAVVRRFIAMAQGRAYKIIYFEVANEGWKFMAYEEARRWARLLREGTPNRAAITSPRPGADLETDADRWYRDSTADLLTVHPDRDQFGTGLLWRPMRQPWEVQFYRAVLPRAWSNDEGIGPASSVAADDDPLRLTVYAAATWLCGGAAFVLHAGAGIRGRDEMDHPTHPRPPNLWQTPNIEATLGGILRLRSLLPATLPNWTRANSNRNFPAYPFETDPLEAAILREDMVRAFLASDGASFVALPMRLKQPVPFTARRSMSATVLDPMTGAQLAAAELAQGETIQVPVGPIASDGYGAVLLLGRFR